MPEKYEHISKRDAEGGLVLEITTPELRTPEVTHALRDEVVAAVHDEKASNVLLDLKQVTFLGSVGMLVFLAVKRLPEVRRIVLCNLAPSIREVLLICKLLSNEPGQDAPLEHIDDVDEALAAIAANE